MSSPVELAFPCDLVGVELTVVPDGGLTGMERAVLGAIATGRGWIGAAESGAHGQEGIAEFLGLHRRLVLDVLHGLWVRGHVTIDFATALVSLTEQASSWLRDPAAKELESGSVDRIVWSYLHEPVSGTVLPADRSSRVDDAVVRMPRSQTHAFQDIDRGRLIRVLQADLEHRDESLSRRIVGVSLVSGGNLVTTKERFVVTDASVNVVTDGGLRVRLSRDAFREDSTRRRLERHINSLCDAEPNSEFAQKLRSAVGLMGLRPPEPARTLLGRMRDRLDATLTVNSNELALKRREVLEDDGELQSAIRGEMSAAVSAEVVSGQDELLAAAATLLRNADSQVVIAAPKIRYGAVNGLYDELDAALEREVRVVLLWGERTVSTLDDRVSTLLLELRRRHSDRLLWSPRSAPSTMRFMVCDSSRALVGSTSPLECTGPDAGSHFGVLVGPADYGNGGTSIVDDLLAIARSRFPDYELSQFVRLSWAAEVIGPTGLEVPARLIDQVLGTGNVHAWVNGWREVLQRREHLLDRLERGCAARVVGTTAHRDLLEAGLGGEGQVVVGGSRVRGERQAPTLRSQLRSTRASLEVIAREHDLEQLVGDDVRWSARPIAVDGGVVIANATVVVTAFDPFANDSVPVEATATIQLSGASLAAEIAAAIGGTIDDVEIAPESLDGTSAPLEPLDQLLELQSLDPGDARSCRIDEILGSADDSTATLDRWAGAGADDGLLRTAAGRLVIDVPHEGWSDWLVRDALRGQRFVEALAVAVGSRAEPTVAGTDLLALLVPLDGVFVGAERAEQLVLGVVDQYAPTDIARTAAVLGTLVEVLARPASSDIEALGLLVDGVHGPALAIFEAVVRYVEEMPVEVPLARMRAVVGRAAARQETENLWQDVADRIEQLRENEARWNFDTGEGLHEALFASDGMLALIDRAAGEPERRARLLDQIPKPTAVKKHIDGIIAKSGLSEMEWGRQAGYLQRLERIVRDATRAAARADLEETTGFEPLRRAALQGLADALVEPMGRLRYESSVLDDFAGVAERFVSILEPLLAWREVER